MDSKVADKEPVIEWFREKLANEKLRLDSLHALWLQELRLKLTIVADASQIVTSTVVADSSQIASAANSTSIKIVEEAAAAGALQKDAVAMPRRESTSKESTASSNARKSLSLDVAVADPNNYFQIVVMSKTFEVLSGCLIIANMVVMALEAQYVGLGAGYVIRFPGFNSPKEDIWTHGDAALMGLDFFFGSMYTIELVLKIVALGTKVIDGWNVLDFVIVVMWYVDTIFTNVEFPINMMLIRLLRLLKVMRMVKLLKALSQFEQLFLIITSLKGSMKMLLWTSVVLFSLMMAFALLLNQLLVNYVVEDSSASMEVRQTCFMYFGTFSRSVLSMFEVTLGNWIPIARFLVEDVSELFVVFTLCYKLIFGFAVLAVINGCFIKETFKVAESDDQLMILQKENETRIHLAKMMKLLNAADASGDGNLTEAEFVDVCKIPEVNQWMGAQGLRIADAESLFQLIDDGSGSVSKAELITGVSRLKGFARGLDLAHLSHANNKRGIEAAQDSQMVLSRIQRSETEIMDAMMGIQLALAKQAPPPAPPMPSSEASMGFNTVQFAGLVDDVASIKDFLNKRTTLMPLPQLAVMPNAVPKPMQASSGGLVMSKWGCS